MASRKIPVLDSVGGGVEFLKTSLKPAAGVLIALAAAAALNETGQLANVKSLGLLGGAAYFVLIVIANGTLFRLAFAKQHQGDPEFRIGRGGLQWSKPEWRLLGAILLLVLFAFLVLLAWLVLLMVCGVATAVSNPATAGDPSRLSAPILATAGGLTLVLAGVLLWLGVRLCLYLPATVAEKHIRVFSTWRLTKGQFWPILGATILVSLPSIVVGVVAGAASVMTRGADLKGEMPIQVAAILGLLFGAVTAFVQMPLTTGLLANIYQRLQAPAGVATRGTSV